MEHQDNLEQKLKILEQLSNILIDQKNILTKNQIEVLLDSISNIPEGLDVAIIDGWNSLLNDVRINPVSVLKSKKAAQQLLSDGIPQFNVDQILNRIKGKKSIFINPLTLDFGELFVGEKRRLKFTIKGAEGSLFVDNSSAITLSQEKFSEQASEILVTFTPTTPGILNSIIVADDGLGSKYKILLKGLSKFTPFKFSENTQATNKQELAYLCVEMPQIAIPNLLNKNISSWLSYIGEKEFSEEVNKILREDISDQKKLKKFLDRSGVQHNYLPPLIEASREIDFGIIDLSSQDFQLPHFDYVIKNIGGDTLTGDITSKVNWLKISSPQFKLQKDEQHSCHIKLSNDLKASDIFESGSSYEILDQLELISNDSNFPIAIKYQIKKPIMQLSRMIIDFSKTLDLTSKTNDLPKASLTIKNIGTSDLKGNLESAGWIKSSNESFSISPGSSLQVDLTIEKSAPVSSDSISNESYAITINSNAGTHKILCKYKALSPIQAGYYANLAKDQIAKKQYKEALDNLQTSVKLDPNRSLSYQLLGDCYHFAAESNNPLGDYDQAIKYYSKAIDLEPQNSELIHRRGKSYQQISNHELALQDLNKSIQMNPKSSEFYYSRSKIYRKLNKLDFSLDDIFYASQLSPSNLIYKQWSKKLSYQKFIEPIWVTTIFSGVIGLLWGVILWRIGFSIVLNDIWSLNSIISGMIQGVLIGFGIVIFTKKWKPFGYKFLLPIIGSVLINGGFPGFGSYFLIIFSLLISIIIFSSFVDTLAQGNYYKRNKQNKILSIGLGFALGISFCIVSLQTSILSNNQDFLFWGIFGVSFGLLLGTIIAFSYTIENHKNNSILLHKNFRLFIIFVPGLIYIGLITYFLYSTFSAGVPVIIFNKFSWYLPTVFFEYLSKVTQSDWINNFLIFFGINFHNWIGKYLDNSILIYHRDNPKIFLPVNVLLSLGFSFFITKYHMISYLKHKDEIFSIINTLLGIITFLVSSLFFITVIRDGAWDTAYLPWKWEWPLILLVIVIVFLLKRTQYINNNVPAKLKYSRYIPILSQILIIFFFSLLFYYSNSSTVRDVEIRSDRSWQNTGVSIAKGQSANINCVGSTWTINKNNVEQFPYTNLLGSIKYSELLSSIHNKFPSNFSSPGSLLGKVGMSEEFYYIGNQKSILSKSNGYIYLRINDIDDHLWDNAGIATCKIVINRPVFMESFSGTELINSVNQIFNYFIDQTFK